jgi:N6-adenosine-specific RNA methylase IME4
MTWEGLTPPYKTIVADPPWDYGKDAARWLPFGERGQTLHRPAFDYSALSLDEIAALPVRELADDDARLFLWTTNKYLPDAFDIVAAWGFTYRQTLVWYKTGAPPFGGSVAPNAAEFLLVGTCGQPRVITRAPASVVVAPKARAHSAKPPVFLDLVEQVSPGPFVELFARRQRLGWDSWGYGYEVAS